MDPTPYRQWLKELTSLPTAAGCEGPVVEWVRRWARARKRLELSRDRFGNLVLARRGVRSPAPIFFTAHMDHPAFVVREVLSPRELIADFRGGVDAGYFVGTAVRLHLGRAKARRGIVTGTSEPGLTKAADKSYRIQFRGNVEAGPGEVLMWDIKPTRIKGDRVLAPACDDLAGVAAALAAFDAVHRRADSPDVRVLLTRCEEVGFIGAIAACKARTLPRKALVIALENSRSFAESPIGGGPIVRVGDRTSTFDPDLTYRIGAVAAALAGEDKSFQWQRKLMPGGTCEASAYQSFGLTASCICLPLGNYHNQNEATQRIDAEEISLRDYDNLVKLLAAIGRRLHDPKLAPPLRPRLESLFQSRVGLLK
jgi:endoglucanase